MAPPSTSEAASQPSGSSSESRTSAVKLRLVLRQQAGAPGSACSYNDSLPSDCTFETWRQRVNSKFNAKATVLSFGGPSCNHPLNDEADLHELRRQYHGALQQHTKASVFRLTVTVLSSSPADPQPATGVLTRRQRSLQLQLPTQAEAPAPSAATHNVRKAEVATTPTPAPKKQRAAATDVGTATVLEVTPIAGVSLQDVIRSIVRTVDKHHFGHHLAAAASAAS